MDTSLTVLILFSATLVLFMTPGLSFFYGGLSRKKNVGNTIAMTLVSVGISSVMWMAFGFSVAFGKQFSPEDANPIGQIIGGFDRLLLNGYGSASVFGTYVDGLPDMAFALFQGAFCIITLGIIVGSVSGRMKFGAVVATLALWVALVYGPLAHMVWGGGLIGKTIGALDFAGGDVVHISSGVAGLVLAIMCGKRRGYGNANYRAHNTPLVSIGVAILWFGWFGFNGGSALAADDGVAVLAMMNTLVASGAAMLSWMAVDKLSTGHSTLVGAVTGLVAGLVAITPGAGFVTPLSAAAIGAVASPVCYFAIAKLKSAFGYDDALDAFGCHAIGGIVGGILVGLLCVPELSWTDRGGLLYTADPSLLLSQIAGIAVTLAFVVVATAAIALVVKACFGGSLRVSPQDEARGMDVTVHGEDAYPAFDGMD